MTSCDGWGRGVCLSRFDYTFIPSSLNPFDYLRLMYIKEAELSQAVLPGKQRIFRRKGLLMGNWLMRNL